MIRGSRPKRPGRTGVPSQEAGTNFVFCWAARIFHTNSVPRGRDRVWVLLGRGVPETMGREEQSQILQSIPRYNLFWQNVMTATTTTATADDWYNCYLYPGIIAIYTLVQLLFIPLYNCYIYPGIIAICTLV